MPTKLESPEQDFCQDSITRLKNLEPYRKVNASVFRLVSANLTNLTVSST